MITKQQYKKKILMDDVTLDDIESDANGTPIYLWSKLVSSYTPAEKKAYGQFIDLYKNTNHEIDYLILSKYGERTPSKEFSKLSLSIVDDEITVDDNGFNLFIENLKNQYMLKWKHYWDFMENEKYNALDNIDTVDTYTRDIDVDRDETPTGQKKSVMAYDTSTTDNNTRTFTNADTKTYDIDTTDDNTRTLANSDNTTFNISTTDDNTRTLANSDNTTFNISTTDNNTRTHNNSDNTTTTNTNITTQNSSGGRVTENLTSAYDISGGSTPISVATDSTTGGMTTSGTGNYVSKDLEIVHDSSGKKTSSDNGSNNTTHSGTIADVGNGGKTGTENIAHSGTVKDVGTGSKTGTENNSHSGTITDIGTGSKNGTETTAHSGNIGDSGTGSKTGTETKTTSFIDYTTHTDITTDLDDVRTRKGFGDAFGRLHRQYLFKEEYEVRRLTLLDVILTDIRNSTTLDCY